MPLDNPTHLDDIRRRITELTLAQEEGCIRALIPLSRLSLNDERAVTAQAREWLPQLREATKHAQPIERLIHRFRLTDKEGVALMALAEALPRIPDDVTADALIADKLSQGNWREYLERYPDMISKLAWLGLSLGKDVSSQNPLSSWISKISQHGLREAVRVGMRRLGEHFVKPPIPAKMQNVILLPINTRLKHWRGITPFIIFPEMAFKARLFQSSFLPCIRAMNGHSMNVFYKNLRRAFLILLKSRHIIISGLQSMPKKPNG
jgi:hypothetical protein